MNSIYICKKISDDGDSYYLLEAVDYADAKRYNRANSLYKLSKTDTSFNHVSGNQAVYKKIYELAKSGIRDFDETGHHLVFGENKEIFAERPDRYWGDFEFIEVQGQGHE